MRFLLVVLAFCFLLVTVKAHGLKALQFSHLLWTATSEEQQAALNSNLIKGMVSAKLNPSSFGAYMIQDVAYLYNTQRIIEIALRRTKEPTHQQLLRNMSDTYTSKYEYLLDVWPVKYTSGVRLGRACSNYLHHLYDIAVNYDTPRYKLWPWLGNQIGAKQESFGVYTQWVEENLDPTSDSSLDLEKVINQADATGNIDGQLALTFYRRSMENERDFFSSVP